MKTFILTLVIICVVVTAGMVIYLNCHKTPSIPVSIVSSSSGQMEQASPEKNVVSNEESRRVSDKANDPTSIAVTNPVPHNLKVESAVSRDVDILISTNASFKSRRELWQKLKEAGKLDEVIAELKQRAANDPNDPEIPTALGVGLMNKFPVQDFNDAAMLGLQIDQNFNMALKLDPANWEAQYEKANSMSYWPDAAGSKGPEIIQRLSSLIDQQETMTPQPEFAKTYVLLGNQYQKTGQSDQALATWQLGLSKFPNDSTLQKKVNP